MWRSNEIEEMSLIGDARSGRAVTAAGPASPQLRRTIAEPSALCAATRHSAFLAPPRVLRAARLAARALRRAARRLCCLCAPARLSRRPQGRGQMQAFLVTGPGPLHVHGSRWKARREATLQIQILYLYYDSI